MENLKKGDRLIITGDTERMSHPFKKGDVVIFNDISTNSSYEVSSNVYKNGFWYIGQNDVILYKERLTLQERYDAYKYALHLKEFSGICSRLTLWLAINNKKGVSLEIAFPEFFSRKPAHTEGVCGYWWCKNDPAREECLKQCMLECVDKMNETLGKVEEPKDLVVQTLDNQTLNVSYPQGTYNIEVTIFGVNIKLIGNQLTIRKL